MSDFKNLGLDSKLRKIGSLGTRPRNYTFALSQEVRVEPTAYLHPVAISKGTVQTTLGGFVDFRDTTGGTQVFTYDPDTGVITLAGPLSLNGTITFGTVTMFAGPGTFTSPVTFNSSGTIVNSDLTFNGGTTDGTAGIHMFNSSGQERITLGIDSSGFGFGTVDELRFKGNTDNKFQENFGVVTKLADSGGVHAFRVRNVDNTEKFAFTSAGFMEVKGTRADPGGGGAGVARIFVQNSGGKDQLRVEFNTGSSVVMATEP